MVQDREYYTVPVKSLDICSCSMFFLYFVLFTLHCGLMQKTTKLRKNTYA